MDQCIGIDFVVFLDAEMRLKVEPIIAPTNALTWLDRAMGRPGGLSENLVLSGTTDDGLSFFSDSVHVRSHHVGNGNLTVGLSFAKVHIEGRLELSDIPPMLKLHLRGFKSYPPSVLMSSLGTVRIGGAVRTVSNDQLSGHISITAPSEGVDPDWRVCAEEMIWFILRGLSFASGKHIHPAALEVALDGTLGRTFFSGRSEGVGLAPVSFMEHGNFTQALVRRYESLPPVPDMLWTVIGWLNQDSATDGARLLSALTALETLCEHIVPKTVTTLLPKSEFAPVRAKLEDVVSNANLPAAQEKALMLRISMVNGVSFVDKLKALRDHYRLHPSDFPDEEIAKLVKLRNQLVHRGRGDDGGRSEWGSIVFVRELLSLSIFREIHYSGPYQSYLNGCRTTRRGLDGSSIQCAELD